MSAQEGLLEGQAFVRSSVKIEQNAKGAAQPKISVYEGTTDEEMQRLVELAVRTYEVTCRRLGMPVQIDWTGPPAPPVVQS